MSKISVGMLVNTPINELSVCVVIETTQDEHAFLARMSKSGVWIEAGCWDFDELEPANTPSLQNFASKIVNVIKNNA